MLERLLLPEDHAIAILMKDHDIVKALFERFEKARTAPAKEKIIKDAVTELKIHATIEEEIFYPAVRKHVGDTLMNEADEEHHVARVLVAELDQNSRSDHRDAKFTVLAESVRHHIKEEEGQVLPKAKGLDVDFQALGQKMLERKAALMQKGVPRDAEHAMVAAARGRGDTPAAAAHRTSARKITRGRAVAAKRKVASSKQSRSASR